MRKTLPEKLEHGRMREGHFGSTRAYGPNGVFFVIGPNGRELKIMASEGDGDEVPWEHVSVSTRSRPPNWTEMCFVKDLFWEPEECVMQLHPPKSEYVNNHPHCLHLWRPTRESIPMPPSSLVGDASKGVLR